MKIYFISGLGTNKKAFERLKISKDFEPVFIDWKQPEFNETLQHYAHRMADEININEQFHLVGLSFGGIIAQEMNAFLNPDKTILISTIQNRAEMPRFMKLSSRTAAHKAVPIQFFTSESLLSYSFFRKIYDPRMPKLNEFFTIKDPFYLKWSIHEIVNWRPNDLHINKIYRMHGDKDLIFPVANVQQADIILGGSHIMVLQKPREVSKLLAQYLLE
ncbi:MAG: alpha/beta hydrolase [Flavobacteriaceae bacterium]|nr:alpha/beta hydrolase [Flavobacteriaceae bacterium]